MKAFIKYIGILLIIFFAATTASGNSFFSQFVDPKDGNLDMSQWLSRKTGFLPIPILISDPAIGYGGGLGLAFFHDSEDELKEEVGEDGMLSLPPSVSFLVGAGTENGSWLAAGGHVGSWKEDSIRYTGAAGYGAFNLKFYGIDPDRQTPDDDGLEFNIEGFLFLQELTFRIKESNFFIGGRYSYFNATTDSDIFGAIPGIPSDRLDDATGGLGLIINYDSRDNIISPSDGHLAKLHIMFYNEAFGGDYDYTKIKASSYSYWPILDNVVLGVRLEGDFIGDDAPFYDVPYIDMRGIPALRYQGENVIVTELEARWDITYRWSLVGFGGSGWTAENIGDFGDESAKFAGGGGFRYLIARRLGLRVGLDIAVGPEDTVVYMGIGSAWN
jgi:hypothetical protein